MRKYHSPILHNNRIVSDREKGATGNGNEGSYMTHARQGFRKKKGDFFHSFIRGFTLNQRFHSKS